MGKIKANEIEKHDASQITINSDTHVNAGQTLSVDTIAEKTSGSGVTVDGELYNWNEETESWDKEE